MKKKPKLVKKNTTPEVQETPKYTDLRQVMDYTKPLSIFYSGVEYETYLDILYNLGIRNFLMSYEYLKGKGLSQLKKYPDMRLFIDSGAYTYMNDPKYEDYTLEQWEDQIQKYLHWAEKHKSQIFAICDLDLQYIVGTEPVYEWRKRYFEPFMLRTGIPVCFMYHDEGLEHWEYMCKRYPYVGLSLAIDNKENGYEELKEMFRIAEKHNALCQGMASTKTSMLVEFPFYTVDSTTWNVGLKYGEISVWNETKMSRIKKVDFQNKAFPIISRYDKQFDFEKILEEDKTEMIRVNAYAFVMAEKFIRERLKSTMYWLKAKTLKRDAENLPDDFFPTPDWFETSDLPNFEKYAREMNINPEFYDARTVMYDLTTLLNWDNPLYADMVNEYKENDYKIVGELHDFYVNRIVNSPEEMVSDLQKFFKECLSGENDRLLQLGTNFDRTVQERDSYIEDEETELREVSNSEVASILSNLRLLPDSELGAPEIDELDAEIFQKANIIPTFDEKGRFVKGQVAVRKPKQVYSSKYPKFACDTCYAASRCPEYKSGYVCAYSKMFTRFDTRDMGDIIQALQGIVSHHLTRTQRSMLMEVINGTVDPTTSQLMDTSVRYLQMLKQMYDNGNPEVLKQTKVVRADGTEETTTSIMNPQSGGIMEKLFGSMVNPAVPDNEPDVIEVEATTPNKNARYENLEED